MENRESQVLEDALTENTAVSSVSARRTKKGFTITSYGAIILLTGCLINIFLPTDTFMYELALYGPTTVGASMVIYGFYCVFE
ncbi:MAG: hypothetical protein SGJ00_03060 [bacterium]|nr:hypothetical protein [bacterium]